MKVLGTILGLRVQTSNLKVGARGQRYDPGALHDVVALTIDDDGVVGWNAEGVRVDDIHHRDHPASKYRGENGISLGFTAHYEAMRARFGAHLVDGIAGENILVGTSCSVALGEIDQGLVIARGDTPVLRLEAIIVAEPCLPFSRFALGITGDGRSDQTVKTALAFLREGCRGYYACYSGAPVTIRIGDRVLYG